MNNGTNSFLPVPRRYFVSTTKENLPDATTFNAGETFQNELNTTNTIGTVVYQPGQVQLGVGQIQFYNGDNNQALDATAVADDMSSFYIAQARDTSLDTYSLPERPFERSEKIPVDAKITLTARLCEMDRNCAWVIGVPNASTSGNINVNENTMYGMTIAFEGHWALRLNARNNPAIFPNFKVQGTWTELGISTAANQRDYIVQNLVHNINRDSLLWGNLTSQPIVALAIKTNSGAGTQLSALTPGVVIPVAYKFGNTAQPVNLTITNGIYKAILAAIASGKVAATDRVVVANPTTAGNGTHSAAQILVLALDRRLVDTDRVRFVKHRIEIGLTEGFTGFVANNKVSTDFEGFGLPRHVLLDYQEYAELNKAFRVQLPSGNAFQYAVDIVNTRPYLLVDMEWTTTRDSSAAELTTETELITLAIPCCDMELRADWQAFFNGFMASLPNCRFKGSSADTSKSFDLQAGGTNPCNTSWLAPFKEVPATTV